MPFILILDFDAKLWIIVSDATIFSKFISEKKFNENTRPKLI